MVAVRSRRRLGIERLYAGDNLMMRAIPWIVLWLIASHTAFAAPQTKRVPKEGTSAQTNNPILVCMKTSMGNITLELNSEKAPMTVANFLRYVDDRFYDGTVFHRVVPYFLIQGGGYTTASLKKKTDGLYPSIKNEWNNRLKNVCLTIGAARIPGKPDSATSQFYINVVDNPRLDEPQEDGAGYAVFGRVVKGEDVVEKIRMVKRRVHMRYRDPSGKPVTPFRTITIKSMRRVDADGNIIESEHEVPDDKTPPEDVKEEEVVKPPSKPHAEPKPEPQDEEEEEQDRHIVRVKPLTEPEPDIQDTATNGFAEPTSKPLPQDATTSGPAEPNSDSQDADSNG